MIPSSKNFSSLRSLAQLFGAICFFLIIPFGMMLGVILRLFGGTHRKKDRVL